MALKNLLYLGQIHSVQEVCQLLSLLSSLFKLPKGPQELQDKWITSLNRDIVSELSENNISICINNFTEEDIFYELTGLSMLMVLFLKYHLLDLPTT